MANDDFHTVRVRPKSGRIDAHDARVLASPSPLSFRWLSLEIGPLEEIPAVCVAARKWDDAITAVSVDVK